MDLITRSARIARILQGRGYSLTGSLLTGETSRGAVVPLDPATGGELEASADPAWILSTPREATDGHIVRQFWDLSRGDAAGPGIPVLFNHQRDALVGQWRDLKVSSVYTSRYDGEALIGRSYLPGVTAAGREVSDLVRAGLLKSTSVGWIPGERVRRSELAEDDPLWRAAEEDECGQPAEGFVMGSSASPNRLMEASLVTVAAQADAVSLEHQHARAMDDLAGLLQRDDGSAEAAIRSGSLDRLLFLVARDPRARSWMAGLVRSELSTLLAEAGATSQPTVTLGDLLG